MKQTNQHAARTHQFYQDKSNNGLRQQVANLAQILSATSEYFADLLGIDKDQFEAWLQGDGRLDETSQGILADFWQLHLHLLSLYDCDTTKLRDLYLFAVGPDVALHAAWSGSSLKDYIGQHGQRGIREVARWTEALRFENRY